MQETSLFLVFIVFMSADFEKTRPRSLTNEDVVVL